MSKFASDFSKCASSSSFAYSHVRSYDIKYDHRVTNGDLTNGALREQFSELQLQLQLKLTELFLRAPLVGAPLVTL